ncbi:SDR family oxidoreductase [Mesorhizobium sp. M0590]
MTGAVVYVDGGYTNW